MLHFPGFEPLTAAQHHARYVRAADLSGKAWGLDLRVQGLGGEAGASSFDVDCTANGATVASRIHILDHQAIVAMLAERPGWKRLASGFYSAATIAFRGGAHRYFLSAWRFGLFFLYPFVLIAAVTGISIFAIMLASAFGRMIIASAVAAVIAGMLLLWLPLLRRLHVPLLLDNWKFALMMAGPLDGASKEWLEGVAVAARAAFDAESDEYVITAHSMGANIAVQVIGVLLEKEPDLFRGKRVVFVTMGGAVLQCALIRSAVELRSRVGNIARQPTLDWIDVQCLIDPVSFYRSQVVLDAGHGQVKPARIVFMRIKKMVSQTRYRKMRGNFLRVHRQYVLGSDARHSFDFTYLTAGPESASAAGSWAARTVAPAIKAIG